MLTQSRRPAAILVALVLAGCAAPRPQAALPRPATTPTVQPHGTVAGPAVPAGARTFDVDSKRSQVTILVHRAGPLASFAHNHVVTSGEEAGYAWLGSDPAGSGFEIHVPVESLVVDDPAARAAAGKDFERVVPESAREGTRTNMMRPEVLDGAEFTEVVVRSDGLGGSWDAPVAEADLTIRGSTRRIEVPIEVQRSADRLVASGSFRIRQSDFGITPFSAAGGAIQVADELELQFTITAVAR
jgi:polyisoprenoid-binding protein YceI